MELSLNVNANHKGCFLSPTQLDLLTIVNANNKVELEHFLNSSHQFDQLNKQYLYDVLKKADDLEYIKKIIFETYKKSFISTIEYKDTRNKHDLINKLRILNFDITDKKLLSYIYNNDIKGLINYLSSFCDIEKVKEEIFKIKGQDFDYIENVTYEEIINLNKKITEFDSLLLIEGKMSETDNKLLPIDSQERYYKEPIEKAVKFAKSKDKHIRLHCLINRLDAEENYNKYSKEEIISIIKEHVIKEVNHIKSLEEIKIYNNQPVINEIDVFNELLKFNINDEAFSYHFGLTIEELIPLFEPLKQLQNYNLLYNEPFMENKERRTAAIKIFEKLYDAGLVNTLGTQMHITENTPFKDIKDCFEDLKKLQERKPNCKIEITEFDLSISTSKVKNAIRNNEPFNEEEIYKYKQTRIDEISKIISESKVKLEGISYWSLTDSTDCNTQRIKQEMLNEIVSDGNELIRKLSKEAREKDITNIEEYILTNEEYINYMKTFNKRKETIKSSQITAMGGLYGNSLNTKEKNLQL